ncbi:potassium-transporting ATPase subunit C [Corynebacterium oculi]|uniref:Potassium-transporting ATPase KdpC subunit n=1 Tax=Corynebacterium oculi TaxID=1544416 RepID=A0A0Q1A8N8_9CORY|nr:potassium-transporting ATPase subunit C [Corynebacterium oculi]KQB83137.1 Potassium-transporting ATPase C chain [Corynebacterium oculi]
MTSFPLSRALRAARAGGVALALFTLILGLCYPLFLVGFGAVVLPHQAAGSPLYDSAGNLRGSALLAQAPQGDAWFYPRPSAGAGQASNASPADPAHRQEVEERRRDVSAREHLAPGEVPPEALTASGSGLDPHVSQEYAEAQVPRVARHTGLSEARLRDLIARSRQRHALPGSPGGALVNVTTLNAALADAVTDGAAQ